MKKYGKAGILLVVLLLLFTLPVSAGYDLPEKTVLSAKSAMLIYLEATASGREAVDQGRDMILYEKNADAPVDPAAVVRMMVGAYAVTYIRDHNIDLNTTGTYTQELEEDYIWGTGLSTAMMEVGETWTLQDLLSLSMIQTAADACVTMATALCGSVREFVDGMNALADELGCSDATNFINVHGLADARQTVTARDLYRITRYALDFPEMVAMLSNTEYTVKPVKGGEERSWENTNYLMRSTSDSYYAPVELGKTGTSEVDGRSVVSVAQDGGYRYLCIVLGCPDATDATGTAHYTDSKALYRWGFNDFEYAQIYARGQPVGDLPVTLSWDSDTVPLVTAQAVSCLVPNGMDISTILTEVKPYSETLEAPVEKGTPLGKLELYIRIDEKVGEVELVAGESVGKSELMTVWSAVRGFFLSPWFWAVMALLLLLIIGYVILLLSHNTSKKRGGRQKQKRKYKPLK